MPPSDPQMQTAPRLSRGGGRRRRMFTPGDLEALLLHLLREGPRHGYDLMGEIEHRSGSGYAPSAGVLYPALQRLEGLGAITLISPPSSRQRVFALTREGEARLSASDVTVSRVLSNLALLRSTPPAVPGAQIDAALERLQAALLKQGSAMPAALEAQVAARLDDLALTIRRRTPPASASKKETS